MADFIDANLLIRYLLNEPKAELVEKLFISGKKLYLTDIVLAEVIWTLTSFYRFKKEKFIQPVLDLLAQGFIEANKKLLKNALEIYGRYNVDYIDAYLAASVLESKGKKIYSFDRDYDKIPGIHRVEPK